MTGGEPNSEYERLQASRSLFNRRMRKGQVTQAFESTFESAASLHPRLAVDLGQLLIDKCIEENIEPTPDEARRFISLFRHLQEGDEAEAPMKEGKTTDSFRFASKTLSWMRDVADAQDGPSAEQAERVWEEMNDAVADGYAKGRSFGTAITHLLLWGRNDEKIHKLLAEWQIYVYQTERDLLILRTILLILSVGRTELAGAVLRRFAFDFDSRDLPAPLQCAYLLVEAASAGNWDFYNHLQARYALVMRRDPTLGKYLDEIDHLVFRKPKRTNGVQALMKMFLGDDEAAPPSPAALRG